MSSLHKYDPWPASITRAVASSNLEYSHENCSFDMSSFMDDPKGWDRSIISLTDPSFLGAEPIGEQWVLGKGGWGKGPAVWPRDTSLLIACCIRSFSWSADRKFLGNVAENSPVKPMSKPLRSPSMI